MKLFSSLFIAGLPGIILITVLVLPKLLEQQPVNIPMYVVQLLSALQSTLLLAAAVFIGVWLHPKVKLQAPVFAALSQAQALMPYLRPQILPGILGGFLGGFILWAFGFFAPAQLVQLQSKFSVPLSVKLLYGGITEEILMRWGLMSLLVWLLWFTQKNVSPPSSMMFWLAISLSSVFFGLGHLPAAIALAGNLTPYLTMYIIVGNTLFGLIAGYLFWQYGLEAAIIAHILAHILASFASYLWP